MVVVPEGCIAILQAVALGDLEVWVRVDANEVDCFNQGALARIGPHVVRIHVANRLLSGARVVYSGPYLVNIIDNGVGTHLNPIAAGSVAGICLPSQR